MTKPSGVKRIRQFDRDDALAHQAALLTAKCTPSDTRSIPTKNEMRQLVSIRRMLASHLYKGPTILQTAVMLLVHDGENTVGALVKASKRGWAAISRIVDNLEVNGFAKRFQDLSDLRSWKIKLTAKGRRVVDRVLG